MNYNQIYTNLIDRAKNRELLEYSESHHIVPRCLGGTDDKDNLVRLTPEEHYLAHQLLVKINPNEYSLIYAANMMSYTRPGNKIYGWLKRKHSKVQKDATYGSRNPSYGTIWVYNTTLKQTKKVAATVNLENGWQRGRVFDFEKYAEQQNQKQVKAIKLARKEKKKRLNKIRSKHYRIKRSTQYREAKAKKLHAEFITSLLSLRKFAKKKEMIPMTLSKLFSSFIKEYKE